MLRVYFAYFRLDLQTSWGHSPRPSHVTTRMNRETANIQASQLCITAYTLETHSSGHFWYIGTSRMVYVLPLNYAPTNPTFLHTLSWDAYSSSTAQQFTEFYAARKLITQPKNSRPSQNCETRLVASSCLSVRPHARMKTTRLPLDGFSQNLIFEDFSNMPKKNQVSLKSDKNNVYSTWKCFHIYDNLSVNSPQNAKCFRQKS
jgi:hypothetical protein